MQLNVPQPSQTVTVIGSGRRFVAYIIDNIFLSIFSCVIAFGMGQVISLATQGSETGSGPISQLFFYCLSLIISALYFAGFWTATGQTPGKMATGIKVVKTDGSPVTFGSALVRWLGYLLGGIPLGLGLLWVAFDSKRQGWHDKMAGTYVVSKDMAIPAGQPLSIAPADSGGGAVAAVFLIIVVLGMVSIVTIAILLVLGPVVGNVFSNIVENLGTPTP
ncbi:MAG: RDD family protein [Anaerolineaceae bacterium]|nr:RDD family protein [Anaerolineaceae bacterium]MCB9099647.1 RDD family protein [Anaerolineales bacterium]